MHQHRPAFCVSALYQSRISQRNPDGSDEMAIEKQEHNRDGMMAQAQSLNWAVEYASRGLNQALAGHKSTDGYVAPLGLFLSAVILQALAAETALKAVQVLKLGRCQHTHDLLDLYEQLPQQTKEETEAWYPSVVRQEYTQTPQQDAILKAGSIRDVFRAHKDDFVNWRYFYELGDGVSIDNVRGLHLATKTILLYYHVYSMPGSIPLTSSDITNYLGNRIRGVVDS